MAEVNYLGDMEDVALRVKVYELVRGGLSESDALVRAMPNDRNRRRRLNEWKRSGLWPPPEINEGESSPGVSSFAKDAWSVGQDVEASRTERLRELVLEELRKQLPDLLASAFNEMDALPESWQDYVREMIARTPAEKLPSEIAAVSEPGGDSLEEPPVPERIEGTKKYARSRKRLAGTVPEDLLEEFETDRARRGKNISQMLEFILYNHYRRFPVAREST